MEKYVHGRNGKDAILAHLCGNGWCCNPYHLRSTTQSQNMNELRCHSQLREAATLADYLQKQQWCKDHHHERAQDDACFVNEYK